MSKASNRRQIRNYLLDRHFQLRYTLFMVAIAGMLTTGLGCFWYDEVRNASKLVDVKGLATMSENEVKQLEDNLVYHDRRRLLVLIGFGVLFAILLAGYGIIFTHKVAGPLHKIGRHMIGIKEGNLSKMNDLRHGDLLRHFWMIFSEMHAAICKRVDDEISVIDQTIGSLEGQGELHKDTIQLLTKLRNAKQKELGG